MPIAGKGMLLTSMDVAAEHEADFNRWYDREHLAERVAIPGFVEARRYVAVDAAPKYLSLYTTRTFATLDSEAYRTALANQTPWSKANIARFANMIRAVARITASRGQGRGAALGVLRLRPDPAQTTALRDTLVASFNPAAHDGVIAMHLIESDPALSRSLTDPTATEGAADWFILIDGTATEAVSPLVHGRLGGVIAAGVSVVSGGTYRLLFDIAAADL